MTLEAALVEKSQPKATKTALDLIATMRPEIEKSLQSEAGAEMLVRHYYSAIRYSPLLQQCTAESVVAALLLSAQVRLEPGPLGHVYLVPFKAKGVHEVVWMLGYTGIIELARRGGAVGLRSTIVWDQDEYVPPWEDERGVHYKLVPGPRDGKEERSSVLVTWTDAKVRQALDVPRSRIERARKASPALRNGNGIWVTDEDAAWRKTGVRAARAWLPLTTELAAATAADDRVVSSLDVVDGEAVPVIEGEET